MTTFYYPSSFFFWLFLDQITKAKLQQQKSSHKKISSVIVRIVIEYNGSFLNLFLRTIDAAPVHNLRLYLSFSGWREHLNAVIVSHFGALVVHHNCRSSPFGRNCSPLLRCTRGSHLPYLFPSSGSSWNRVITVMKTTMDAMVVPKRRWLVFFSCPLSIVWLVSRLIGWVGS